MDVDPSDDQRPPEGGAVRFLDGQCPLTRVRAHVASGEAYDRALWLAMIDREWPATAVPEALGGLGRGAVELVGLLEQTGAHLAPTPFLQAVVTLDALATAAERGVAEVSWLEPLLRGDSVAAVTWPSVRAERQAGRWLLSGRTGPVLYGPTADVVVLPGEEAEGSRHLFVVNARARRIRADASPDPTRQVGWVDLDATPALHLGDAEALDAFLDLGAVAHAAELLGIAERVLAMTSAHADERARSDRATRNDPAELARRAEMRADVEGMRSAVHHAARRLAIGGVDRSVAASGAKARCSEGALRVLRSSLQLHGGAGAARARDLDLFLGRAELDEHCFGDAAHHRARSTRLLGAGVGGRGRVT